ncbi:hypothetical protein BLNAU_18991 [Blattamonas nauphoetae]|uniref:Uncharacterized protein n=1 Tax=Blattamonas nauphoetae TaxID=2049346 RepID=A0ABQ9X399_9EUKA|nr:hypothetical protein BLNAU_18991 [Blattamonas nauphoetae]
MIAHNIRKSDDTDAILKAIGQNSTNTAAVVFCQPRLAFICSSDVPMAFLSLLSKVELEYAHQATMRLIFDAVNQWKACGTESASKGRIVLQELEKEGFGDGLEQDMLHKKLSKNGNKVRTNSLNLMKLLGMNTPSHV